jgi:hypothetical protein
VALQVIAITRGWLLAAEGLDARCDTVHARRYIPLGVVGLALSIPISRDFGKDGRGADYSS